MSRIDQTIRNLVDAPGTVVAAHPLGLFLKWLGVTAVTTAFILLFMSARDDLAAQMVSPLFLGEIASLFSLILATAVAAVWLCFPDLRQKPAVVFLPILPAATFVLLSVYRILHPEITTIPLPEKVHGLDCVMCITVFAAVPGFWMFHILRRHATIWPKWAGALSFLAASAIGLLALKLVEPNDSVLHLVQWHIIPMIILAAGGGFLGEKYLSW